MSLFIANGLNNIPSAVSCDGQYLYILNSSGLFKVGSGYGSTIKVLVNAASVSFINCSWKVFHYKNSFLKKGIKKGIYIYMCVCV